MPDEKKLEQRPSLILSRLWILNYPTHAVLDVVFRIPRRYPIIMWRNRTVRYLEFHSAPNRKIHIEPRLVEHQAAPNWRDQTGLCCPGSKFAANSHFGRRLGRWVGCWTRRTGSSWQPR